MKPSNVIFAASEAAPFSKTGGLGDVMGSLPEAISLAGAKVGVFLPYYRQTRQQKFAVKLLLKKVKVSLGQRDIYFSLYRYFHRGVDFYFINKKDYFDREYLYGGPLGDYSDNALRFAFFSQAVLSSLKVLEISPDIIHCNEWQTALIPFYLKKSPGQKDFFPETKTLFTVHNLAYQGLFPSKVLPGIGIEQSFYIPEELEFYGQVSFIKAGILYSDALNTVSEAYSRDILTGEFGFGLEGLLQSRSKDIYGIINGIDYSKWNPETDNFIKVRYNNKSLANKAECKRDILSRFKMEPDINRPLCGIISRLAQQKGIDILIKSFTGLINLGCSLVVLGKGEERYERVLRSLSQQYTRYLGVHIGFDESLAHKIEAGCDMYLMPSYFEPCGLNQMYSLKYGTIPVVHSVGGLEDTVIDYQQNPSKGTGFKFRILNSYNFLKAVSRAIEIYKDKRIWKNLMVRAMKADFSWRNSAFKYMKLYGKMRVKK
ncbi:MAG: glycogen synthase GlgA [Candidatus Omnitrophica bacterium]|nr:glycogen synthase GlgA [Candidatus Omnitrophota bacterium]MDD5429360.1 glycogen synthase GlgA [Candidatus Omnitrophota bacterium]